MFRIFQRTLILISIVMFQPNLVYSQVLYLDKQFDFTRTSEKFASKPVFGPGNSIGGNIDLYLELFTPDGPNVPSKNPLIILIHGGGFKNGSKSGLSIHCEEFAKRGYVAASLQYSTRKPALRWMVHSSSSYHGTTTSTAIPAICCGL